MNKEYLYLECTIIHNLENIYNLGEIRNGESSKAILKIDDLTRFELDAQYENVWNVYTANKVYSNVSNIEYLTKEEMMAKTINLNRKNRMKSDEIGKKPRKE